MIHVLSVDVAWIMVGGDFPTSNMWIDEWDQKSAELEFCDKDTLKSRKFLELLLLLDDFDDFSIVKLLRDISSSLWDSRVVDEIELESPLVTAISFFDLVNFDLHPDFDFSGGAINGTVWLLTTSAGSTEIFEAGGTISAWIGRFIDSGATTSSGENLVSAILFAILWDSGPVRLLK
jgi:hypothetical protein